MSKFKKSKIGRIKVTDTAAAIYEQSKLYAQLSEFAQHAEIVVSAFLTLNGTKEGQRIFKHIGSGIRGIDLRQLQGNTGSLLASYERRNADEHVIAYYREMYDRVTAMYLVYAWNSETCESILNQLHNELSKCVVTK